jgi:hypothetical protein
MAIKRFTFSGKKYEFVVCATDLYLAKNKARVLQSVVFEKPHKLKLVRVEEMPKEEKE